MTQPIAGAQSHLTGHVPPVDWGSVVLPHEPLYRTPEIGAWYWSLPRAERIRLDAYQRAIHAGLYHDYGLHSDPSDTSTVSLNAFLRGASHA